MHCFPPHGGIKGGDCNKLVFPIFISMKFPKSKSLILFFFLCFGMGLFGFSQREYFSLEDTSFKIGQTYTSYDIRFDLGKYSIKPYSFPFLDSITIFLKNHPYLIVEIGGHTDSRAPDKCCQRLDTRRAKSVMEYLHSKGVDSICLQYNGYGESRPNTAYIQNGKYYKWKPENDFPFERILLTEEYINQFKSTDKATFEMLHQMNRRTEIVIVGFRE